MKRIKASETGSGPALEEYRRYPRMRADVESVEAVDKGSARSDLPAESSLSRSITESSDPDAVCPVDIADTCQRTAASNGKPKEAVAGGTSENAVAVGAGSTDKNAFPESAAQSALESRKLPSSSDTHDEERRPGVIHQERAIGGSDSVLASSPRRSEKPRRRLGKRGLSGVSKEAPRDTSREKSRKRRVNTIVLTDADFVGARIDSDDDFSEFEEEGGGQKVLKEGILISQLPFKPKADIGDLDRVTAEEFCPLTLEDEVSCGETTTWP
ncbi:uncharacterized protein [Linepithema humile]|uniref:uncharacterized protein isoform X2 n=1 Tax=Linepithema humile TaxID=83485 RepID=UPI0006239E6B|nr:PREDICTED: uncharacterized protein LOC105668269 isoform X2 [Linepithema humile]